MPLPSYEDAASKVPVRQGVDRRVELQQCLKSWHSLASERGKLLDVMRGDKAEGEAIILEIGNSGFPRYDYVYVGGMRLSSSLGHPKDLSRTELGRRLGVIYNDPLTNLQGDAQPGVDDGDCYFLTVEQRNSKKTVAVYGTPESSIGQLVRALVMAARR
jgi:hypothetical protein